MISFVSSCTENNNQKKTNEVKNFIGSYVKCFVFCDHSMVFVFPYKGTCFGAEGYNHDDILLSMGIGTRITLPGDLSLRMT